MHQPQKDECRLQAGQAARSSCRQVLRCFHSEEKKREEEEEEGRSARQVLLQHLMSQQGQINRFCSLRLGDLRVFTGLLGEGAMGSGAEAY